MRTKGGRREEEGREEDGKGSHCCLPAIVCGKQHSSHWGGRERGEGPLATGIGTLWQDEATKKQGRERGAEQAIVERRQRRGEREREKRET